MLFSIGNIITILLVFLILLIYRQIDRNNRSLEKVKKYSNIVIKNISAFVDGRTAQMKDLSSELQSNFKTVKELFKKVKDVETYMHNRVDQVDNIQQRIQQYDKSLNELVNMSGRVDENLKRIRIGLHL